MPVIKMFWLGEPCQYDPGRADLESFPAGDLGGRELGLPVSMTPQEMFDATMPRVVVLQAQAQQRFQSGAERQLHPFGILAQGIQTTWMLTSEQVTRQQAEIDALKATVERLEAKINGSEQN